jgi:hypothetical protein
MRTMSITSRLTWRPVAGAPMNSPWWRPWKVLRVTTLSSSATWSWISALNPSKAAWKASNSAFTPSRPGGKPGRAEWSTKSSAISSTSTAWSSPVWYSVTNRFISVLLASLTVGSSRSV